MPLPDNLLNPIPGENPSGEDLRYAPIYDQVKEARRAEEVGNRNCRRARRRHRERGSVRRYRIELRTVGLGWVSPSLPGLGIPADLTRSGGAHPTCTFSR